MIKAFVDLVKNNQKTGMIVCEIGVYAGWTTMYYAPFVKEMGGKIYAVDWFYGNIGSTNQIQGYHPDKADGIQHTFETNLTKVNCFDIVKILRGHSTEMAKLIPNKSLDICFIDADLRYEGVLADIKNYLPKVKKGGIICGHDIKHPFPPYDINTYTKDELSQQSTHEKGHVGVSQAVYDIFGSSIKIIHDPDGDSIPIWMKRL